MRYHSVKCLFKVNFTIFYEILNVLNSFQVITLTLLAIMGSMGRITSKTKRRSDRINLAAMIFSLFTTIINVAITSFSSRK